MNVARGPFAILSAAKDLLLLLLLAISLPLCAHAQSNLPFNHYLAALKSRAGDTRAEAFARECLSPAYAKATRQYLYTEGANWVTSRSLPETFEGYDVGDANTAQIWLVNGTPRAVYLWEVDLEYERDSLFCIAPNGDDITRSLSRFFPAESGLPREHWTFVHTVHPGPRVNTWVGTTYYEDKSGKRLEHPTLTAEDKDFIAGERTYHYWNDFDFSQKVAPDKTQPKEETPARKMSK